MILGNHEDRYLRGWLRIPIPGREAPPFIPLIESFF
jgi:hypothetical protein